MSGHETSFNKCKKNDIIHNAIKLEINNNKRSRENPKYLENKQHTCKKCIGQRRNHF